MNLGDIYDNFQPIMDFLKYNFPDMVIEIDTNRAVLIEKRVVLAPLEKINQPAP